jgi:thiosulfate dehydrogenase [quinone] large subunit
LSRPAAETEVDDEDGRASILRRATDARWLFASPAAAWIWLIARLYLGYEWFTAGYDKVFGSESAAYMKTGAAVKGFSSFAATELTKGDHPAVAYGWYKAFLTWIAGGQYHWIAKVVAVGELLVGIALILGLFTGLAAFFGVLMNFTYLFAGSAGVNPAFVLVGIGLILAWRIAGYMGADRWVLPFVGTWDQPGPLFSTRRRGMHRPSHA